MIAVRYTSFNVWNLTDYSTCYFIEPHALYDTVLAFKGSWSELSAIPWLEKDVEKDLLEAALEILKNF